MSFTDIFDAAKEGTVEDVMYFINEKGVDVNAQDKYNQTPLHLAVGRENLEIVKFLVLEGKANVNAEEADGKTPLHLAATYNNSIEVAKFLVANGAKVNATNKWGYTPLHNAVGGKNIELVKYLVLEGKANVDARDGYGGTPLHTAVRNGQSAEIIDFLVSEGKANVNAKDNDGSTPLHSAAMKKNAKFAEILISKGADINAKDNRGLTPLGFALHIGDIELTNIFNNAKTNAGAENHPSEKAKRPLKILPLIIMIIGGVVCGSIAASDGGNNRMGILISVFFGMGLGPFIKSIIGFFVSGSLKTILRIGEGIAEDIGLFGFILCGNLILWWILLMFCWILIKSPFVAILQCLEKPGKQSIKTKIVIVLSVLFILSGSLWIAHSTADTTSKDKNNSNAYKTVKIGTQTWMAENLNVETGNSACYENNEAKCQECGRLYDWETAIKACPKGWHLPSQAEWAALGNAADGTELKSKSGWESDGNGTDKHGFSALPCGRYYDGKFLYHGRLAQFWSATENDADHALGIGLDAKNANMDMGNLNKSFLRSIRCVQD